MIKNVPCKKCSTLVQNHILVDEDHIWHSQSHYKENRLVCFHERKETKKKIKLEFLTQSKKNMHFNVSM
jgi:hypothetical protein